MAQLYYACLISQTSVKNAKIDLLLADSILQIASDRFQEGLLMHWN
jgi:hypothetical protein